MTSMHFVIVIHFLFQVPELAGSWLLTILIQFPLIMLLLFNEDAILLPMERAVHIVMALFVFFELICGYFAIRFMVNYQVTKFHLKQFSDLEHLPDSDYWQDKYDYYTQSLVFPFLSLLHVIYDQQKFVIHICIHRYLILNILHQKTVIQHRSYCQYGI